MKNEDVPKCSSRFPYVKQCNNLRFNIQTSEYAENVTASVYVIGSNADKTLSASLQEKMSDYFENSQLKIFDDITHENYFISEEVV